MKVLHVIPEDGIGGVEVAARSAALKNPSALSVLFLSGAPAQVCESSPSISYLGASSPFSLSALCGAVKHVRNLDSNVVVFSLWKSFPALLLLKVFLRRPKYVLFLHTDRPSHVIEAIISKLMIWLVDAIWADSNKTLTSRLGHAAGSMKTRVISFVLAHLQPLDRSSVRLRFIFWGRLTKLKRIDRAIEFFATVARKHGDAGFVIIGPDDGCLSELKEMTESLSLEDKISFVGAMPLVNIIKASGPACFYLQLSDQEGMAISVVEAMQLGLIPIVTPVGEMAHYCRHMENGVVFRDNESALASVEKILADPGLYSRVCSAAAASFDNAVLYDQDFLKASAELLK